MCNFKMTKFTGKKEVLATPMFRGDYNKYRGWDLPKDECGADEGVLVEYLDGGDSNHKDHDGYISWSPIGVFSNAYKASDTFLDRLTIERDELGEKIDKLEDALTRKKVPESETDILFSQCLIMKSYFDILSFRILKNS